MSTKLEAMVGYLSGRDCDAQLIEELADPSSEASRFLEATRERSRAMLGGPVGEPLVDRPKLRPESELGPSRRRFAIAALIMAAIVLVGILSWLAEGRFRRLEATFARTHAESREDSRRLEAALARLAGSKSSTDPAAEALERVEAGLGRMERRLDALDRKPEPLPTPKDGPSVAEVRDDLATLRRELSAAEKTNSRQVEELRATVQDVARLLRLLIKQAQPTIPEPGFPLPRPPAGADLRRGP